MTSAPASARLDLDAAVDAAARELDGIAARTGSAAVAAQAAMARDPALRDAVRAGGSEGLAPVEALDAAVAGYARRLAGLGGAFAERAVEVADAGSRIRAHLLGTGGALLPAGSGPHVLFADDLAAADAVRVDPARTLAVVLRRGGPASHAAIVLRSRGIPLVLGVGEDIADGTWVRVDAGAGSVGFDPDEPVGPRPVPAPGGPGRLADGTPIALLANVASLPEAEAALAAGAEGIGLLRTELMFLDAGAAPGLAQQRARYARVLRPFAGRPVVARTFDPAPDKPLGFAPDPAVQLAALAAAARDTGAELRVIAPMIRDARQARAFAEHARGAGIERVGIMAEVPELAAEIAAVAAAVDVISIGTNDLTALTLGADRGRDALDAWDPRVLRLIRTFCSAGVPAEVCGEAAADPRYAVVLVGLGATALSMAPEALPAVRSALAAVDADEARARADAALVI
ncbi:MAG TPA: putative PEP-binding protein [Pseudolysinimonas sp.]|nr:putative PEP-binding protein [Pseudolysinimonas sp.]